MRDEDLLIALKRNDTRMVKEILNSRAINLNKIIDNKMTPLSFAIKFKNLALVEFLISKGAKVELPEKIDVKMDITYLIQAVINSDIDVIKLLLENGARKLINNSSLKVSALVAAVLTKKIEIVNLLLDNGADPDIRDSNDRTPLIYAIYHGCIDIVKVLIEAGANINACSKKNEYPLSTAILHKHYDLAKLLVSSGANVNVTTDDKTTILLLTLQRNVIDVFNIILENKDLDFSFKGQGIYALSRAVFSKNLEIVRKILDKKNIVNEHLPADGRGPLFLAYDNLETAELLIERGVDINSITHEGNTALHYAVLRNDSIFVNFLLSKGAKLEIINSSGDSPLSVALKGKASLDIIKTLVRYGADINEVAKENTSIFSYAVARGDYKIVKFFLDIGVKFDVVNAKGQSPFYFILKNSREKIEETKQIIDLLLEINRSYLKQKLPGGQNIFHLASFFCRDDILKHLLKVDFSEFDSLNNFQKTPFAFAMGKRLNLEFLENTAIREEEIKNCRECIKLLLDQGADLSINILVDNNALHVASILNDQYLVDLILSKETSSIYLDKLNSSKYTPLHLAVLNGHIKIVESLLAAGANPDHLNKENESALYTAIKKNNFEIAKMLIKYDADIYYTLPEKNTLLHYAVEVGNFDIVKLLFDNGALFHTLDDNGASAIFYILEHEEENIQQTKQIIDLFVKKDKDCLSHKDYNGDTITHLLALSGQNDILKYLLGLDGVNINALNENGESPFSLAIKKRASLKYILDDFYLDKEITITHETIKLLIDNGANINISIDETTTALHVACYLGDEKIVDMLLYTKVLGVDTTSLDKDGLTPLHIAVQKGFNSIVKTIVHESPDINKISRAGEAPLHLLAKKGDASRKVIDYFIEGDANINVRDYNGCTPLMLAIKFNQKEFIEDLIVKRQPSLDKREDNYHDDIFFNCCNNQGETALSMAAKNGEIDIVNMLLASNKTDLDIANLNRETPLFLASKNGHIEVVLSLIKREANINKANYLGFTPLHAAVISKNLDIVRLLLEHGAKTYKVNYLGETPVKLAEALSMKAIVDLIREHKAETKDKDLSLVKKVKDRKGDFKRQRLAKSFLSEIKANESLPFTKERLQRIVSALHKLKKLKNFRINCTSEKIQEGEKVLTFKESPGEEKVLDFKIVNIENALAENNLLLDKSYFVSTKKHKVTSHSIVKFIKSQSHSLSDMLGASLANFMVDSVSEMSRVSLVKSKKYLMHRIKFLKNAEPFEKTLSPNSALAFAISLIMGDHDYHDNNIKIIDDKSIRIDFDLSLRFEGVHYAFQRGYISNLNLFNLAIESPELIKQKLTLISEKILDRDVYLNLLVLMSQVLESFSLMTSNNYNYKQQDEIIRKISERFLHDRDAIYDCRSYPNEFVKLLYTNYIGRNAIEVRLMAYAIEIYQLLLLNNRNKYKLIEDKFAEIESFKSQMTSDSRFSIGRDIENIYKDAFVMFGTLVVKNKKNFKIIISRIKNRSIEDLLLESIDKARVLSKVIDISSNIEDLIMLLEESSDEVKDYFYLLRNVSYQIWCHSPFYFDILKNMDDVCVAISPESNSSMDSSSSEDLSPLSGGVVGIHHGSVPDGHSTGTITQNIDSLSL